MVLQAQEFGTAPSVDLVSEGLSCTVTHDTDDAFHVIGNSLKVRIPIGSGNENGGGCLVGAVKTVKDGVRNVG